MISGTHSRPCNRNDRRGVLQVELDMVKIREWARENGHRVGVRGPINSKVLTAYLAAQSGWVTYKPTPEERAGIPGGVSYAE